jgi:hypothetical protein
MIVLGQTSLSADSFAALRVLVRDHAKLTPIRGAQVRLAIKGQGVSQELGVFRTGRDGSLSDAVYIPSVSSGKYDLIIESRSEVGRDQIVRSIEIKRACRVYLTTDKPVYQPGQIIHMRALVLNAMSLKPFENQLVLFEITDAKRNKVFKANLTTSKYGIASHDLPLANEVNLGDYEIRAVVADVESEKTVTVQRYVLPKFKIQVSTDKSYYLPSERISGSIKAAYFFGKPVANAQVEVIGRPLFEVRAEIFRVEGWTNENGHFRFNDKKLDDYFLRQSSTGKNVFVEIETRVPGAAADTPVEVIGRTIFEEPAEMFKAKGRTDATGQFTFESILADYYVEQPISGKNALFEIEVRVKDGAAHEETVVEQCPIAQQPINIHAFAEGSNFLRGAENIIYIMTAYPDGQPAVCKLDVNGTVYTSDETGITVFKTKADAESLALNIKAQDHAGLTGTLAEEIKCWFPYRGNNLIVRTDKAVYHAGETLRATLVSKLRSETFFLDFIKNGQTVLTRTLWANDGRAELAVDLSSDLCGFLKVNAYAITKRGTTTMDSQIVYVRQAKQLRIEASLDKAVYRPGDTATLGLAITDNDGIPTPAALSLTAVDEAVFYVCGNRPGVMGHFFSTDEQFVRPVYQIAFAVSPDRLLSGEDKYQNLARVLFSHEAQMAGWRRLLWKPDYHMPPEELHIIMPEDYTLRAESYPDERAHANAFRHRYFEMPLAILLMFATPIVSLGMFGLLAYSVFRLFRWVATNEVNSTEKRVGHASNRRVYVFAFLVLLPTITYLTSILLLGLLGVSRRYYYSDGSFDIDPRFLGVLVVAMVALSSVAIPLLCRFDPTSSQRTRKSALGGFVLSLICVGLIFAIEYFTTGAIMNIVTSDEIAFWVFPLPFLLGLAVCLEAGRRTRKMPGRFYNGLGRSGQIILVMGLAQTSVLLVLILLPTMRMGRWTLRRSARTTARRRVLSSTRSPRVGGHAYGGMGGYGGGYMGRAGIGAIEGQEDSTAGKKPQEIREQPRIREYFPETLLWQPEVITDDAGRASLDVDIADSITAWKMNVDAVSATGRLGSSAVDIHVFQDFFVDADLPVTLTRNDEVSIPVLCYNYLQRPQTIQLTLQPASWCEVQGSHTQLVELGPNDAKSARFRIKASKVGIHELTVLARGSSLRDAVQRSIEVRPDGTEVEYLRSGVLSGSTEHVFHVPSESIPDSQKLLLKLYPSMFSEVVEGLDNIFRMPYGCFEQASSVTYPNIMALLYMKRTGQVTPEIEVRARKFITAGYQRLLTFAIDGGGFSWFGKPPAEEKLTAYGIMQLTDMSKVHDVDEEVIERASRWLLSRQNADGSWNGSHHTEVQNGREARMADTAYITWALAEAGIRDPELDKALVFLRQHPDDADKPYILALTANALLTNDPNDSFGNELMSKLNSQFRIQGDSAYIDSSGTGAMYSRGVCLDIETTALSALAIMKANPYANTVRKALTWLSEQKDQYGTWYSTQATILAMKALIVGAGEARSIDDEPIQIAVTVNSQPVDSLEVTSEMRDLLHTLDLTTYLQQGENNVCLTEDRGTGLPYRLVGSYWVLQAATKVLDPKELDIQVDYDRNRLAVDDMLTCSVHVAKRGETAAEMAIVDLAIPPGFRVRRSAFEQLVESGSLEKYELTANRCVLYVGSLAPDKPMRFSYELKPLYPMRAQVPSSSVYEYYQPESRDRTKPIEIAVVERL